MTMEITDVKVRLVEGTRQKVKAFCSVTFDDSFVVKDIKVIEGEKGEFIAMPSRKLSEKCGSCGRKNPVGSSYCSSCGSKLPESHRGSGQASLYSDIAHPINADCRRMMQDRIVGEYRRALEAAAPVAELADEPPVPPPVEEPPAEEPPAQVPPLQEPPAQGPPEEEPPEEESKEGNREDSFSDGIC
jgi:stage V sporulation protein G